MGRVDKGSQLNRVTKCNGKVIKSKKAKKFIGFQRQNYYERTRKSFKNGNKHRKVGVFLEK